MPTIRTRAYFQAIFPGRQINDETNNDWDDLAQSAILDEDVSAFVRTILDDANAAAVRATIGAGVGDFLANGSVAMTGDITLKTASVLTDYGNGKVLITGTTPMLALGGTASTRPALKYVASPVAGNVLGLASRLADDSDYAAFIASRVVAPSMLGGWDGSDWGPLVAMQTFNGGPGINFRSGDRIMWCDSATNSLAGTNDVGLARNAAGVLEVNNGSAGSGGALQFWEQTAPAAPAANSVRLYAEDSGGGKTRLMARFNTGAAVQVAIEP